ncbi:MAG: flagellar hook-length control protein FliK [Brevinematia bacterium]
MNILNLINLTKNEDILLANLPKNSVKSNFSSEKNFGQVLDGVVSSQLSLEGKTEIDNAISGKVSTQSKASSNQVDKFRNDKEIRSELRDEKNSNTPKIREIKNSANEFSELGNLKKRDVLKNFNGISISDQNKRNEHLSIIELLNVITAFLNVFSNDLPNDLNNKIKIFQERVQNEKKVNLNELIQLVSEIRKYISNSLKLTSNADKPQINEFLKKIEDNFKNFLAGFEKSFTNLDNKFYLYGDLKSPNKSEKSSMLDNLTFEIKNFRTDKEVKENKKEVKNDVINFLATPLKTESSFKSAQPNVVLGSNAFILNQSVLNEFTGKVLINLKNGNSEMKMTLFPPELGKVFVKFESIEGKLVGNIVVSTREAYTLFEEHLSVLKDNLVNQGVNVQNITLTIDSSLYGNGGGRNKELFNNEELWFVKPKLAEEKYDHISSINNENYEGQLNLYV